MTPAGDASIAPKACPFCRSPDVKTTSKEVNVSTYWRCTACGQIWNGGRLQRGSRAVRFPR
jgi:ribosomal protein L37AE/L43A